MADMDPGFFGGEDGFDPALCGQCRDDALRDRALYAANVYAMQRTDLLSPTEVVERAEAFYRFLNGEAYGIFQ